MEETPREKRYLSGDAKPSSVMAIGLFGLAMAGYGRKQNCCQIGQKYRLSFRAMSMQYKILGMERKLTSQYSKVVSCDTFSKM